jgi:predicted AlkP superfamily phosphohydrolase/phosphomutase
MEGLTRLRVRSGGPDAEIDEPRESRVHEVDAVENRRQRRGTGWITKGRRTVSSLRDESRGAGSDGPVRRPAGHRIETRARSSFDEQTDDRRGSVEESMRDDGSMGDDGSARDDGSMRDRGSATGDGSTTGDEPETEGTHKTLVLGFDALSFRYLDEFADDLPNIGKLRSEGVEAPLRSTFPPWTGCAWPSMYTGMDPDHHGVYDFFEYDDYPDEGSVASRNDVKAPAIWNYLDGEDIPSIVMNVPVTHPAEEINGVIIPGYLATEDDPGHPETIRDEVSELIGEEYRIYSRAETSSDKEEKLAGYLDLIDLRRRAAVELLEGWDWEFAFLQLQKTDAVFHNFDEKEAFRRVYEAADQFVESALDAVDEPVNVILCSDHGIGPKTGYQIYVNEILKNHGYVVGTEEASMLSLSGIKTDLTGDDEEAQTSVSYRSKVLAGAFATAESALDRVGVSPMDVFLTARRLGLEDALMSLAPDSTVENAGEAVDWRASKAYLRGNVRLGIRINLEGRDSAGVVPPEEYETVRSEIIELFSALRTPDGKPAFDAVRRREEVYDGPYAEQADDVLLTPRNMNNGVGLTLRGREFMKRETHDHKFDGVFVGAGPDFGTDAPERLSLTDVAPICMALMGRPVPSKMTGRVPADLLEVPVDVDDYGPVEYGTEPTGDDEGDGGGDEEVTERLEDLGYL